jgi:hypothetical protein
MFDLDEFLHHVSRVRERTRRVAACIPAEHVEWTYKPGAFTLGDLVRHIAFTERYLWAETPPPIYGMTATQVQSRSMKGG